ncbi:hypothetical protein JKF63_05334 [Porcisia hertigi]|uniref:Uncharacterized protein n=1 Tax=Porcisia hertigi TaxID=2761500 RepID=A0A836IME5_9TRYP|nr:hypothetical protein JKF63_05334 [Porcisia hertigi]
MGCANQRLHSQQIAYQRDFLGACWDSALGDEEATEYVPSRWMGISRQVMELCTKNHCFTVRTLCEDSAADVAVNPSGERVAAPGNPAGARTNLGRDGGVGDAPQRILTRVTASAGTPTCASPRNAPPVIRSSPFSIPWAGSFTETTRQGQHGRNNYPSSANMDPKRVATTAGKNGGDPKVLRRVVKNAFELEKITHSHHPYLQRNELSVYSGVVFRCAPVRRLYNRIAFVPETRARRLSNAPQSAVAGRWNELRQQSRSPMPPPSSSDVAAPDGGDNSSLLREEGWCQANVMPALKLGAAPEGDRGVSDPLSTSNNYPIDDHDVDGVIAGGQPVIVGSITAIELLALPPNAELCFGGWLYVSLQDEQERLRRSLVQYDTQRQWQAARRKSEAVDAAMDPSISQTSTFNEDTLKQRPPQGGKSHGSAKIKNVDRADDVVDDPLIQSPVAARSISAPWRSQHCCNDSRGEDRGDALNAATKGGGCIAARTASPSPAAEAASSPADGERRQEVVQHTPQGPIAESLGNTTPSTRIATTLPSPQRQASLAIAGPLDLSPSRSVASASFERKKTLAPGEPRKRARKAPPLQPDLTPGPLLHPVRRTGKYAQEAMQADALVASWLPYAYVIIAVPMYECSLVPTTFHTTTTRCKAVSLNLANAQSRHAYGVGCITAARYGGVMVVEYREKVNEADDATWIKELLRMDLLSQQKYAGTGAKPRNLNTNVPPNVPAAGPAEAQTLLPLPQRLLHTAAHSAREAKLDSIKARICRQLRRQGLNVILASTRMASRQHRQQRASVTDELNTTVPVSASGSGAPVTDALAHPMKGKDKNSVAHVPFGHELTGDDDDDDNAAHDAVETDSSENRDGGDADGEGRPRDLRSSLSGRGRRQGRPHQRRHHRRGSCGDGPRGSTAVLKERSSLWADPGYDDGDDFLLRGTFRQIGGVKYVDAVSLIDGCPVSELIYGIQQWVVNLLSTPIKARPLSLYLQRYEGIASSLQLLHTQLTHPTPAARICPGRLVTPVNLSFRAGGGTRVEEAASLTSEQQDETMGGVVNTGSFAAFTTQTTPHGVRYNTYYKGPLDPVVQAVLSPGEEAMVAAFQAAQLKENSFVPASTSAQWEVPHKSPTGSVGVVNSSVHSDPLSPHPLATASLAATMSPRAAGTVKPMCIVAKPPKVVAVGGIASPCGIPTITTECPAYDHPSRSSNAIGNNVAAVTNGRVSAPVAVTLVPSFRADSAAQSDTTNVSLAAPSHNTSSMPGMPQSKTVTLPWEQKDLKASQLPSSKSNCLSVAGSQGGEAGDDTVAAVKPLYIGESVGNTSTGPAITPNGASHPRWHALYGRPPPSTATRCHKNGRVDVYSEDDGDTAVCRKTGIDAGAGAQEKGGASHLEREWQLADRELRALKSDLYEMQHLVSTARSELLERVEESIELGAIFLPHTRPDKVALSLLTLKMLRQYPEEVPVKEIHTDWVPMLMSLLTTARNNMFCCAGDNGNNTEGPIGDRWSFLTTYNNAVPRSSTCDATKRRDLHHAGAVKYTIDPLSPLPTPRPLHDIVIAPQPLIRCPKTRLKGPGHVRMGETGLSVGLTGGSLGVLAGVLYYYADFLRSKYRSALAAAGGQPREAGATVQDVLARDGYNVMLRRIYIWSAVPIFEKPRSRLVAAAAKAKELIQREPHRDGNANPASSIVSASFGLPEGSSHVATSTTRSETGNVPANWHSLRGAEAYALYDAVAHYLRTLEELHMEHDGRTSAAPQAPAKHHSLLLWRNKDGPHVAATVHASGVEASGGAGDTPAPLGAEELVPNFEICVASNYYYIDMMEEARRPRAPIHCSSDLPHTHCRAAAADVRKPVTSIPAPSPTNSTGSHTKATREEEEVVGSQQQHQLEKPYCGGEETDKTSRHRHAVKKTFQFLKEHYEEWRARYSDDHAASALAKRIHISIK